MMLEFYQNYVATHADVIAYRCFLQDKANMTVMYAGLTSPPHIDTLARRQGQSYQYVTMIFFNL